ncbi:hypothetical protein KC19_2G090000 [Ceratodon purpureus]|uniref:Uncharacterized protein n=1 Tax=Ceratodon purpureus TaxID=3225 RepID=A0A8T0ITK4_CERPU|nr:hypothetical protein KC19_2G090000 [Ceratodon purpureus]
MAKSSSVAALLLVVAVLVGTCASGAQAQPGSGKVDLINLCANDSFVLLADNVTSFIVKAGETVGIDLSDLNGIIGPVHITISGLVYVITPDQLKKIISSVGVLFKIEIVCNGVCGDNIITIKPYVQLYADGVPTGLPVTTIICADLIVL